MWPTPDHSHPLPNEPTWPQETADRPVVFLLDSNSPLERNLLRAWIDRHRPPGVQTDVLELTPSRRRRRSQRTDRRLPARLGRDDGAWVVPLRVAWLPRASGGRRSVRWADLVRLGDPRDPDRLRQRIVLSRLPDRVRIIVGEGASAAALLAHHRESVEMMSLQDFVTRRAHLALERGERELRGNRYKVPKFLSEELLRRSEFRDGAIQRGAERGLTPEQSLARATHYLREIAATHSPFLIDLIANAIHWVYRQGYGGIIYDSARIREIAALGQEHPVAFLPAHRSNLDRLVMQFLLWENDLPPNHTAGGINMNFFPVGPLIRRTGVFFIRRSFKENELYKWVLRSYLDYLVEKRFPLEWYLEGGRSRSGKLLPPRFGMLSWVTDSVRRGRSEDLYLIPTSIAYDQIQDVADYASEAIGGEKRKESFGWAFSAIRSLRRRYGNIHVRFAEPISVAKEMGDNGGGDEVSLDLQKLAFEVMHRIGSVTPITPTSVVALALLSGRGSALTAGEIARRAAEIDHYVERLTLPTTEPLRLEEPGEVRAVLRQLAEHGSVSVFDDGETPVYYLTPEQALQAAYYRNTIVHFFVPGAIAELAILGTTDLDPWDGFWNEVARLRDLLKYEFFFPEREQFQLKISEEMGLADPDWETELGSAEGRRRLVDRLVPHRAHWALLPFLEAYRIVADQLVVTDGAVDERQFIAACLARGKQYRLQGRVSAAESVSKVLFASALRLTDNRRLNGVDDGVPEARRRFAEEIDDLRRRAVEMTAIADERHLRVSRRERA